MPAKVAGMKRLAVACQVPIAGVDAIGRKGEPPRHKRGIRQRSEAERYVDLIVDEVDRQVAEHEIEIYLWILNRPGFVGGSNS
jgi:hypothetical protein